MKCQTNLFEIAEIRSSRRLLLWMAVLFTILALFGQFSARAQGCPPITLNPSSLPSGTEGIAYSKQLSATGSVALAFYGTTFQGGTGTSADGTVFRVTANGVLATLASFTYSGSVYPNGAFPRAGLVQGSDGNFYGVASEGGANNNNSNTGDGTVFKVTPSAVLTTLASFTGTNGPLANSLVQGSDGNFYGTTEYGGSANDGTVDR